MRERVLEKFLRYIALDTQSEGGVEQIPSTKKQFVLAKLLVEELEAMGAKDVQMDEHAYVFATIPATCDTAKKTVGFIAHMDTAPAFSGTNINPQFVMNYQGQDIVLNEKDGIVLSTSSFPEMLNYVGKDLITTDGNTLLGADDKAGVAEIMTMAEYFLSHPEIPHGEIKIGFTPDEEVGRGADLFDVERFGADVAYTVDGGGIGELQYENFNAASASVTFKGFTIHPGESKGRMKNAALMAMEFQGLLPVFDNPMYTEGYEGFYMLNDMTGTVEDACLNYIIRDHDMDKFLQKKAFLEQAVNWMNTKYGEGTVSITLKDSYFNMLEKVKPHMYLIDIAKAAMEELDIVPNIVPVRGGTDGARLSYKGLPCPNLGTGGHNFHGRYEYVCIQSMDKIAQLLIKIGEKFAE